MSDISKNKAVHREKVAEVAINPNKQIDHVTVQKITMQADTASGTHMHLEPLIGIVLSGQARLHVKDKVPQNLSLGDVFFEPANTTIIDFSSGPDGVVFLTHSILGSSEVPQIKMIVEE